MNKKKRLAYHSKKMDILNKKKHKVLSEIGVLNNLFWRGEINSDEHKQLLYSHLRAKGEYGKQMELHSQEMKKMRGNVPRNYGLLVFLLFITLVFILILFEFFMPEGKLVGLVFK